MTAAPQPPGVTVRDVADRAGVHAGTVSRALNPARRHLLSTETVRRVEQAARELGYEANRLASGLRSARSFSVGVLIPDLTNPFFPPLVRGIEDHLLPHGYTALLANTESELERERRSASALAARQVDGFIFAPSAPAAELVRELIASATPLVLVNRRIDGVTAPSVTPDDRRGAALAVEHLLALGHRRIAHVGGPQELSPAADRRRGYATALEDAGIAADPALMAFASTFTEGAGVAPTRALLEQGTPFTAILAANDLLAVDCIDTLRAAGLECPDDVSVVGFNDMPFAERLQPPLTSVRHSPYEIGRQAAALLLEQIAGAHGAARTVVLSPTLVARGSTAACNRSSTYP
jgi:LacI family transcriptional regulator